MRQLAAILTILALLACPYGCLAGADCCGTGAATVDACCEFCCDTPLQEGEQDDTPAPQSPKTCLCKGAILGQPLVEVGPPVETQLGQPSACLKGEAADAAIVAHTFDQHCPHAYGDGLRIAISSFLC